MSFRRLSSQPECRRTNKDEGRRCFSSTIVAQERAHLASVEVQGQIPHCFELAEALKRSSPSLVEQERCLTLLRCETLTAG